MREDRAGRGSAAQTLAVWAAAFGCLIGSGCFQMPGTTLLPKAGPLGSVLGILLAGAVVLVVNYNYSTLAARFPEDTNSYQYIKHTLGMDHSFLAVWSLLFAYLSIVWANALALGQFSRFLFGAALMHGIHYAVAGYEVYLGEILLSLLLTALCAGLLCMGRRAAAAVQTILSLCLFASVCAVFAGILLSEKTGRLFSPAFASAGSSFRGLQILEIAVLAPWLFVGFETVTETVPETPLPAKRIFSASAAAILCAMGTYIMAVLMGTASAPDRYRFWESYINDLSNLSGPAENPVFYNVSRILGQGGAALLALAVFCGTATCILGFLKASMLLLKNMGEDGLLPPSFSRADARGVPKTALTALLALSLPVPFLGGTVIRWAVDITSLCVSIVYGYVSLCTLRTAGRGWRMERFCAVLGAVLSFSMFLVLIIPDILSRSRMSAGDYLILMIWSLSGMAYYRFALYRDRENRLGQSMVMWLMMYFFLFFATTMWTRFQTERDILALRGTDGISAVMTTSSLVTMIVVVISFIILFDIFSLMLRREKELDKKIIQAEERNRAKTTFLSNMSHDIRTPMNAIMGFTDLALLSTEDPGKTRDYLQKIHVSSAHLLSLINDVLEMSRIESGKLELNEEPVDLPELLRDLETILRGQADARRQTLRIDTEGVKDPVVLCDRLRLNQVLLNLASNAVKYTQEGGDILLRVAQTGEASEGKAAYEVHVKDNGIGMSPEFAERIFEAFEREKTAAVSGIQGTGLGMAITKRIVDKMQGSIRLITAPGQGSEFIVSLLLPIAQAPAETDREEEEAQEDFSGKRVLLVDDIEINREIARMVLEMMGFEVEEASDGDEAAACVEQAAPGTYDVVLMDIQMPRMDGYAAAREIRKLPGGRASTPILAMTANAFEEDRQDALAAGMNGHLAKPIDQAQLARTLGRLLAKEQAETN